MYADEILPVGDILGSVACLSQWSGDRVVMGLLMTEREVIVHHAIDGDSAISNIKWENHRKKPVVIQAVQMQHPFTVKTLEGDMRGDPGDWLIRGIEGELYPCKPEIFAKTYEAVK